ncbi:MAG: acylphosphatase [Nitrososphaerota archaeon]|jgi:acylphosphatase|nr:acylphosphatase [Nitrososphaerota archaeon]
MSVTRIKVYGMVQGVGFRFFVRQQAVALGVSGLARNLSDGSVEVILEGPDDAIQMVIEACKVGPPNASVSKITLEKLQNIGGFKGFRIE